MAAHNTELDTHFAFGENWESYSRLIDAGKIEAATSDLLAFTGPLAGRSFLDIGCGSGLHALAAIRLDAGDITAIDIDPKSVETTRRTLSRFSSGKWHAETLSVLSPAFEQLGQFDVVYSWGVLHHTGNMRDAIRHAAAHVKDGGLFAVAIYSKTPFCGAWRAEKWLYVHSPGFVRTAIFRSYKLVMESLLWLRRTLTGARKDLRRGMDIDHDYRDWLGGYPYESATPAELDALILPLGFAKLKQKVPKRHVMGLFGTGCAEYLYQRRNTDKPPKI